MGQLFYGMCLTAANIYKKVFIHTNAQVLLEDCNVFQYSCKELVQKSSQCMDGWNNFISSTEDDPMLDGHQPKVYSYQR